MRALELKDKGDYTALEKRRRGGWRLQTSGEPIHSNPEAIDSHYRRMQNLHPIVFV